MKESQILEFEKGTHVRIEEADDGDDDDGANGYARSDHSFLCSSLSLLSERSFFYQRFLTSSLFWSGEKFQTEIRNR